MCVDLEEMARCAGRLDGAGPQCFPAATALTTVMADPVFKLLVSNTFLTLRHGAGGATDYLAKQSCHQ